LYNVSYSGNSYKVRLLLTQLGIPCDIVEVDILKGESRTPEFLKINPNGRTPVLDDNGFILAESNAILLAYLARGTKYLPENRRTFALVFQWMFFEQYSHEPFIATSRFWLQHKPDSPEKTALLTSNREGGSAALKIMEDHLRRMTSSSAITASPTSRSSPTPTSRTKAASRSTIFRRSVVGLNDYRRSRGLLRCHSNGDRDRLHQIEYESSEESCQWIFGE
jgi:glutathione S-transferase